MFSARVVSMGAEREDLCLGGNRTTPACPRDVAISRAVLLPRSSMLGLRSFG